MAPTLDFTQFRAQDLSAVKRRTQGAYFGPASYVQGGDPLTPGDLMLGQIDVLMFTDVILAGTTTMYTVYYDFVNQKVIWFVGTTGIEVAAAVNLSTGQARFEAIGH